MARANRSDFAMALDEFVDEFYLDHPDKAAQQVRLDPIPEPVGDPLADAWIGAAGEHLALRWGLRTPDWTQRAVHFALEEPHFLPDARALRDLIIVESPPASARGSSSPAVRARWPRRRRLPVHVVAGARNRCRIATPGSAARTRMRQPMKRPEQPDHGAKDLRGSKQHLAPVPSSSSAADGRPLDGCVERGDPALRDRMATWLVRILAWITPPPIVWAGFPHQAPSIFTRPLEV